MQYSLENTDKNIIKIIGNVLVIVYMLAAYLCDTAVTVNHGTLIQRVAGATGILLLLVFAIRLIGSGKSGFVNYFKKNIWIVAFFVMRMVSLAYHGGNYTVLRQIFFEAVYLVPIGYLLIDRDLIEKVAVKVFVILNLVTNIFEFAVVKYLFYCEANGVQSSVATWLYDNTYWATGTRMYDNCNHMGLITALAMILAIDLFRRHKCWQSAVLAVLYYGFSAYTVWVSTCRNAILCLAVTFVFYVIKILAKKINGRQLATICLLCVTLSTVGIYGLILLQNNPHGLNETEAKIDFVSSGRYLIWKSSTYVHKDDFLIGGGSITLEKIQRYNYDKEHVSYLTSHHIEPEEAAVSYVGPHNAYIGIISTAGVIAFVFYMISLYLAINRSSLIDKMPYMLAVVFILVMNVLECRLITGLNIYCTMLYLILAPEREEENKLPELGLETEEVSA